MNLYFNFVGILFREMTKYIIKLFLENTYKKLRLPLYFTVFLVYLAQGFSS